MACNQSSPQMPQNTLVAAGTEPGPFQPPLWQPLQLQVCPDQEVCVLYAESTREKKRKENSDN